MKKNKNSDFLRFYRVFIPIAQYLGVIVFTEKAVIFYKVPKKDPTFRP